MNNRYIQQFKKGSLEMILLCLIGRKETYGYEIITELNNSASVLENGETEQQVIRRLGTPKEFADSTAEQFGIDNASSKKRKGIISTLVALIVAVAAFSVYAVTRLGKTPEGAI